MGKISNMIYMLDLLNTGNKYTISELANKLNVTERMIRYYKNEFEKNGIYIDSFKGPGGGYFLISNNKYYINFNKYDIDLLNDVGDFLKMNNYKNYEKYCNLLEKSKNLKNIGEEKSKFILNIDESNYDDILFLINKCIVSKDAINIAYKQINGKYVARKIHPLYIFEYNSSLFLTAFCELRMDIRHFEINRIKIIKEK